MNVPRYLRMVLPLLFLVPLSGPLSAAGEPVAAPVPGELSDAVNLVFLGSGRPYLLRVHLRVDGQSFRRVWRARADRFFTQLDRNGDGTLDRSEAKRIDAQNMPAEKSFFEKLFSTGSSQGRLPADAGDGDGQVTREEFLAYLRRTGSGPFRAAATPVVGPNVYNAYGNNQSAAAMLYGLVDTDRDKKLASEELGSAPELLSSFDSDNDEIVTLDELSAAAARKQGVSASSNDAGSDGQNRFVPFAATGEIDGLLRRLLGLYAPRAFDPDAKRKESDARPKKKAPRRISRDRLDWSAELFDEYDLDGDGGLGADELQNYLQSGIPAVELIVRRGKTAKPQPGIEVVRLVTGVASGATVTRLGGNAIAIDFGKDRLELSASGAQAAASSTSFYEQQFDAVDGDNNEYLEKKEVRRNYYFENSFRLMDADGDGKLFKNELTAWLDRQNESAYARTTMSVTYRGRNLFDLVDADGDGRLGLRETRSCSVRTGAFDANRDKVVEADELPRQYRLTFAQASATIPGAPAVVAAVKRPQTRDRSRNAPRWFQKMDINNDGDISPREFLGPRKHFTRLDADGDGLVDTKEAARFD